MPLPAAAIAAIPAVAGLAGSAWNAMSQSGNNRAQREWNERMYGRQREDSLNDWRMQNSYNESMWRRQNEYNEGLWNKQNSYNQDLWHQMNAYNSPAEQMKRFKEAGLNPNLIYGQSNTGGSISVANLQSDGQRGSTKSSPTPQSYNPRAPQFSADGIASYFAARESQARTNNLEKQNEVLQEDALLRSAQTAGTLAETANKTFDLGLRNELRQTSIDAAKESLRKVSTEIDLSLQANKRADVQQASSLMQAAQQIAESKSRVITENMKQEIMRYERNLKQLGIQPTDNMLFRIAAQIIGENTPMIKAYFQQD